MAIESEAYEVYEADVRALRNAHAIGDMSELARLQTKLSAQGVVVDYGPEGVLVSEPGQ